MAAGGERRMLFDVRGRRKHVIRVVYAILAILMGTSLFLVVGPVNIGELIGSGGSSSATKVLDEQAERIERRLARDPTDEALLLSLTRTRIGAGNADVEVDREGAAPVVTPEALAEYEQGMRAWRRYLKQAGGEPNAGAALLVAGTYFTLAQNAISLEEALADLEKAAEAQRIVAAARPSVGSLSTLAIYEYYAGNFAAGDRASKQAQQRASSKGEKNRIENQLAEYRKRGKQLQKQKRQLAKAQRGRGKEALQNPFGGLGSSGAAPGG
jgi:DNA repair exonuclease SbcCD ATPase subunit